MAIQVNTVDAIEHILHMLRTANSDPNPEAVITLHMLGGPGIGKSSIVHQACDIYAEEINEPVGCYTHFLVNREPTDIKGIPMPAKDVDGTLIMNYSKPSWALPHGAPPSGALMLDEYLQADADVHKPSAELINARGIEHYKLPPRYIVVMASNRPKDRSGTKKPLAFLQNRYAELELKGEYLPWEAWAIKQGVPEIVRHFAEFRSGSVFRDEVPVEPGPFCTPRSLTRLGWHLGKLSDKLFLQLAAGAIGEATAAELVAYVRVHNELPRFEEVIANPKSAKLPPIDRSDAMHACMQMLLERIDRNNAGLVFDYIERMPQEFQIAGVKTAFRKAPTIVQCRQFADWMRRNSKLIMAANINVT